MSAPARRQRGIRARLYDADGEDREVELEAGLAGTLAERQLLWIDLRGRDGPPRETVAAAVGLDQRLVARLTEGSSAPNLTQYPDHLHLIIAAMDLSGSSSDGAAELEPARLDLVAGRNWVLTVHTDPLPALDRVIDLTEGETRFGALDAAGFVAAIVGEVLAGYLALAASIEEEIDRLDERALRSRPGDDLLARIVSIRRRVGAIRRTLIPHRLAFAALARPEMELHEELGRPWPGLNEQLDRAINAVENLRDLLLGTYDIHMGRAAQDANEVMKRLTLLSAVLLPAVVLAGIMGMNFSMAFFEDAANFWVVIAVMGGFAVTLLAIARWRAWL